ncbi:MAG: branched-chain amino acid ABC transporter permease [Chloroflexi bacterium]|nr:branched-chain amino acid ABC transporter permease [Chloroflexota bacterium]
MNTFLQVCVDGILLGGVYALIALGVIVVYKSSRVFNIAYGEIMMFLAYLMWFLFVSHGLPVWLALLIVTLAGAALGLACERIFLRPLIGKPMLITFMVCLVLGILIKSIAILWFGGSPQAMDIFTRGNVSVGGISVSSAALWSFVIGVGMLLAFVLYFRYTRTGLGMRCVAEDSHASQSMGISVKRIFALSWAIGGVMAAIGGVLVGSLTIVGADTLGMFALVRALPVLLLGGMESITGALVGGLIIGVTEGLASTYIDPHVDGFRELLPFILIVIILMMKPSGLFGQKTIERI